MYLLFMIEFFAIAIIGLLGGIAYPQMGGGIVSIFATLFALITIYYLKEQGKC